MKADDDESGDWKGLDDPGQFPRYAAIAEMLQDLKPGADILDVGCGEAHLHDWLPPSVNYSGIEPSLKAVQQAQVRQPKLRIIRSSAEAFDVKDARYDCVIFNEMLYYSRDPIGLLVKYAKCLNPHGVILGSIFQKPSNPSWRQVIKKWMGLSGTLCNMECDQRTRQFMAENHWNILKEAKVGIPDTGLFWNIWLAAPPETSSEFIQ